MTRPSQVIVDFGALRENYRLARKLHGDRALAVIKANAYGHGALPCARALASHVDGFAVAFVDEACALRDGGVRNPILVLEGVFSDSELQLAARLDLWLVAHHEEHLKMLATSRLEPGSLNIWLKVDSGMRRAGFDCADASRAYQRLLDLGIARSITLMSHFACADEIEMEMTAEQIERFDQATAHLPGERSLCNSAGLLYWPTARRNWARPGLMLYGISPSSDATADLQPAMTFKSRVIAERELRPGDSLGYGAGFIADRQMRVGLVCAGYADGYPQTAAPGTPVAVDGRLTRLVGRVSMDLLTIDLSDLPDAGIGSDVELWGRQIRASEVARASGRIEYEMLCNVKRAPLIYRDSALADRDDVTGFAAARRPLSVRS